MKKSQKKHMITVGAFTGVSRILGFIRDMITAWLLGAGPMADAFFVAFRIPNLLRRFMAEGAVSVAFVPVFNEVKEKEGLERAFVMSRAVLSLMFIALTLVVIIGELIAPLLVALLAPGFMDNPSQFDITVTLTRIMFPFILLIGIVALFMGILNSLGHFAAPAAAPILLNVGMIGVPLAGYVFYPFFSSPAIALAWGVIIGGLAQILLQLPPLKRRKVPLHFSPDYREKHIRKVSRLMGVAAIGASIYQINVVVGTQLASLLHAGSVTFLYYANRIIELPLGVFAYAVGNVALPAMSTAAAHGDKNGLSKLMGSSLQSVLIFTIPAALGAIILAEPIITILFMRGKFDQAACAQTAWALQMYALGLWAIGYTRIQNQALYAMQEAKVVVKAGWYALIINILASIGLMFFMQHAGIALASTFSVFFQMIWFHRILQKKGVHTPQNFYAGCGRIILASIIMGLTLYPFYRLHFWTSGLTVYSAAILGVSIVCAAAVYFGSLRLLGMRLNRAGF